MQAAVVGGMVERELSKAGIQAVARLVMDILACKQGEEVVEQWLKLVDRFLLSMLSGRRVWNKDKKERMAVELVP